MNRPDFENFKQKALADPEVRKEYDALAPVYELRKKLKYKIIRRTRHGTADCSDA